MSDDGWVHAHAESTDYPLEVADLHISCADETESLKYNRPETWLSIKTDDIDSGLPDDVWLLVLHFLSLRDTLRLRRVCKDLYRIVGLVRELASTWWERLKVDDNLVHVVCSQFRQLRSLDLKSCKLITNAVAADIASLPFLEKLDLSLTRISDSALMDIARIPELTSLSLGSCSDITNKGIAELRKCLRLEALEIGLTKVTEEGLNFLTDLPLKTLDLFECRVRGMSTDNSLWSRTLTKLYLGRCKNFNPCTVAPFLLLSELDLSLSTLDTTCMAVLAGLGQLTALRMVSCGLTDEGLEEFSHSKCTATLRVLDIRHNTWVTDTGTFYLAPFVQIVELYLEECNITDKGLGYLAGLVRLKELDLACTPVLGTNSLRKLISLQTLHLYHCKMTDHDLEGIADLTDLKYLDLTKNRVEGPGLKFLQKCSRLEVLNLFDLYMLEDEHIMPLKSAKHLRSLIVAKTRVTRAAVQELERAVGRSLDNWGSPSTSDY